MPTTLNDIVYGGAFRLDPATSNQAADAQTGTGVSLLNGVGNPNSVYSANPSSVFFSRDTGDIYQKKTGTGNTGWVLIGGGSTDLHTSKYIVGDVSNGANYADIPSAYAAAPASSIIYIQEGIYTITDLVMTKNMIFYSMVPSYRRGASPYPVEIIGKFIFSTASILCGFYGIQLTTDADNSIYFNANAVSSVFQNCSFNFADANTFGNGVSATQSNIYCENCVAQGASTHALFDLSNPLFWAKNSLLGRGGATGINTISANSVILDNCKTDLPIQFSGTSGYNINGTTFGAIFTPYINQTYLAMTDSAAGIIFNSAIYSGSQPAITIGAGCSATVANNVINSSATNVFTGAGTINTGGNVCTGSSSGNNVSVINTLTTI